MPYRPWLPGIVLAGAVVGMVATAGVSQEPSGQGRESLEAAILEVWPDASEWTVEEDLIHFANLDRAVLVSLPPQESVGRIDRYRATRCEHRIDPPAWSCSAPHVRLTIRAPAGTGTCPEPVHGIPAQPDVPDGLLLEVLDHARHDPALERELTAACEQTFRPREVPFEQWRCSVAGVYRSEAGISVSRPAGRGCRSVMTFERSCQRGECILSPVRCAMVCA